MKHARLIVLVLVLALTATVYFITDLGRRDRAVAGPPADFAGRVTIVQIMSEHCPACREMEPALEAVRQKYAGDVDIVFLDIFDRQGTGRGYGISTIPAQLFYDRHGRERHRHEGIMTEVQLFVVLDELLSEQAKGRVPELAK